MTLRYTHSVVELTLSWVLFLDATPKESMFQGDMGLNGEAPSRAGSLGSSPSPMGAFPVSAPLPCKSTFHVRWVEHTIQDACPPSLLPQVPSSLPMLLRPHLHYLLPSPHPPGAFLP